MKPLLFCFITFVTTGIQSQNYIGLDSDSLKIVLKQNEKSFRIDNSTVNKVYKYLKYVDKINEQTWLFFLDENNVCTHHKLMSDYLNYNDTVQKLNEKFRSTGDKTWKYADMGKEYTITLIEEEWFFTVITKEKKD